MTHANTLAYRFFWRLLAWRWPILVGSLLAVVAAAWQLPSLEKDTSADGFIDPDNPALIYRDKVEKVFNLADPVVLAVVNEGPDGIYNAKTMELVRWLTERIRRLEVIDPEQVTSLATESHVIGTADGMVVENFFTEHGEHFTAPLGSDARLNSIREAINDFPLYQGTLVARDGSATVIVAELVDGDNGQAAYDAVYELAQRAPTGPHDELHVAGEGAIAGYLASYIDQDARRLNPIAGVVITLILIAAFMSVRAALLPNLVVLCTVAISFGVMAATGFSFYVITNGLIVNLIGIAVADSIHILSQYYNTLRERPDAQPRALVAEAMATMWRPVTLTTITTAAGFLALGLSAAMPPVRAFGLFGALGVVAAWVYSMTFLPAALSFWPAKLSRPFRGERDGDDRAARLMRGFGRRVLARSNGTIGAGAAVAVAGLVGLSQVTVNDARIENFKESEPIHIADEVINRVMDGTYHLDVMIETPARDDLHKPEHLKRIAELQDFLETLPHVNGTTSIVDVIKQMHKAVNENRESAYRIPDDPFLIAQLFLLYNASGDPTELESRIDHDHKRALVRAQVDRSTFHNNQVIVPKAREYVAEEFNAEGIKGTVDGRVNVDYEWIGGIADNHAKSVALSFGAVLLAACLVFRSLSAGLLAALPVGLAVLLVYAVMGFGGIWLGVGTSMFAAIAIGLGVDFAIHTVDRLRTRIAEGGFTDDAILGLYPDTGRALLFNFLAVALGFGVLTTSDVPPLIKFGSLVAVAVSTAFIAAMTVVPALVKRLRPTFFTQKSSKES